MTLKAIMKWKTKTTTLSDQFQNPITWWHVHCAAVFIRDVEYILYFRLEKYSPFYLISLSIRISLHTTDSKVFFTYMIYSMNTLLSIWISLKYGSINATISALKWSSVRRYLQSCVRGLKTYIRYLCLLGHSGVEHILYYVYALFIIVICLVHYMLPVYLDCPFGFLYRLFNVKNTQSI